MADSAEYDLTHKIGGYLDRHLVLPILEFLSDRGIYDEGDTARARLELLSETNMVDFAMDIAKTISDSGEISEVLMEKRTGIVERMDMLQEALEPIVTILSNPDVSEHIESQTGKDHNLLEYLTTNHEFQPEMIDTLYDYAKFQYDCGNYSGAGEYLYFYRALASFDDKNMMNAIWGKLACEILMQNWDVALEDLKRLKETIESSTKVSPLHKLQQRSWLVHWSLFVFFNHDKGRDDIIDLFLYQPDYLNAIQTSCPHILRYLTAAVITNKRRQNILKDVVKVIKQEAYAFRDPITEFVECLYVNYDFDRAQKKLLECDKVLENDFFLVACREDFIESARLSIFETFCRIHQCISISMLATKLNMTPEEAEKWIVNLIRNVRLDARIDAKQGHVVMNTQPQSIYQRVIDKTKSVAFQTQFIAQSIEKRLELQRAQQARVKREVRWGTDL
ncbi:eukaryotic translation initiation factor 3 subunit E-like isoform X1 [Dysidea avara]|uniref:eukaryotic translation initiation factor 3 subunit E-like isoform X1 n=1 Tax=Dysidea avara TaxID=196820 RepID=UPI003322FC9A